MAKAVVGNAVVKCTFGLAPSSLQVPSSKVKIGGQPVADITASAVGLNISPFGMCVCPGNPAVAAMIPVPPPGVIKPQPCTPQIPGTPWAGCSSKVKWPSGMPLTSDGTLNCVYGGTISITSPGQVKTNI